MTRIHPAIRGMVPARDLLTQRTSLIAVCAVALITRLLGILSRPIWYDEAFAILFARTGPAAMLVGTLTPTGAGSADIHPLGYYTLLWLWMRVFGETLISVRALSILAGLGTIVIAYALARHLFGLSAAVVSGLITALAPFQIHYSQEIRMYAFLGFWLMLAAYCLVRADSSTNLGWWLGFSASAAMAQYTHNLAAAFLIPLVAWPLLHRQWSSVWRIVIAGILALLLYLPWLRNLPAQVARVSQSYWIERPAFDRLLAVPLTFVTNVPVAPELLGLALLSAIGILALGLVISSRGFVEDARRSESTLWLLYMSFAPPLLLFIISQWRPVYLERALIASGVMFCLWLGVQLSADSTARSGRVILLTLMAIGFAIGLRQHLSYGGFPYAPYRALDEEIRTHLAPGDVIVHSSKLSFLPSLYFDPTLPAAFVMDPPGSPTDTLAASTQRVLGIRAAPSLTEAIGGSTRVWFVLFNRSNEEYVDAGYARHPHLSELLDKYRLAETYNWDSIVVYLFTTRG